MKKCLKCNKDHELNGAFCSRACANSRGPRTQEFKEKVRSKLLGRQKRRESVEKFKQTLKTKHPPRLCSVCYTPTKRHQKTCSKECFSINQSNTALKQLKHGRGHKGKYKGFQCDSTYELAYLIWHLDNNISIVRETKIREYTYKNKKFKYLADFVVNGQSIEIKGFLSNRSQEKLIQNPDVKLISLIEIKKYITYVKTTYNVKDLRILYDDKLVIYHICKNCNTQFNSYLKKAVYCSRKCAGSYNRTQNLKNKNCGWFTT